MDNKITYNQLAKIFTEKELNMFKAGLCHRDFSSKACIIEIEKDVFVTFDTFMYDMAREVFVNGLSAESYINALIKRYEASIGTENYGAKNAHAAAFHDCVTGEVNNLLRFIGENFNCILDYPSMTYNNVRDGRFGIEKQSLLEIFNGFASLCKNCMRRTEFSKIDKDCFLSDIEKFELVFAEWSHDFHDTLGSFSKRISKQFYYIGVERHIIKNNEVNESDIECTISDFIKMKYGDEAESIIFIHNSYDKREVVALAVISD